MPVLNLLRPLGKVPLAAIAITAQNDVRSVARSLCGDRKLRRLTAERAEGSCPSPSRASPRRVRWANGARSWCRCAYRPPTCLLGQWGGAGSCRRGDPRDAFGRESEKVALLLGRCGHRHSRMRAIHEQLEVWSRLAELCCAACSRRCRGSEWPGSPRRLV